MTKWDKFFREKIEKIFQEQKNIVDIGGGLRILKDKNNRYDSNREWIIPMLDKVNYRIMDPVSDYNPDIIGDIHQMPFKDNSLDAIICIAVLEHVENPILAAKEMHRSLRSGGACFVYVPFLYYYHAAKGYYDDYWRFTEDSIDYIFKDFSSIEKQSVRGALETWIRLSPFGRYKFFNKIANRLDVLFKKTESKQVNGYNIYLEK